MNQSEVISHLSNLELHAGATFEEVRRAYKDLAQVWHPDRFVHDPRLLKKATERFQSINESYQFLEANQKLLPQIDSVHTDYNERNAQPSSQSSMSTKNSATGPVAPESIGDKLNNFWWVGFLIGALFGHHITDSGWGAAIFGVVGGIIGLAVLFLRKKNTSTG